jgi:hypothetical protein
MRDIFMDQVVMYLTETTDWGDAKINNGIYAINKQGQLVAYSNGTSPFKVFNKPMKQFSRSRRTFTSSKNPPVKFY